MTLIDELGIAFSGAVGIGLFSTSGQVIALGGPAGALLAFFFAGLIIFSVMRSLAEMVSVRPVKEAIMDYPGVFVDEALGFAVGLLYWYGGYITLGSFAAERRQKVGELHEHGDTHHGSKRSPAQSSLFGLSI